jgi:hypothetical protein
MPKNVNFQGSGSVFFSNFQNFVISKSFSPISIPEIAKTKKGDFSKSLTAANFLMLSGINIGVN